MVRILALVLAFGFAGTSLKAEDKPKAEMPKAEPGKEVTLTGDVQCGKCALKESKSCHSVIVVKDGDMKGTYWFDAAASKKYHGDICQETKPGTVKGKVEKKDDKMVITVTSLEYAK